MLNLPSRLSLIIINDQPQSLDQVINVIAEQVSFLTQDIELIIVDDDDRFTPLSKQDLGTFVAGNFKDIKIVNYQQFEDFILLVNQTIVGEIILVTKSKYMPDNNWIPSILNMFINSNHNFIVGQIINKHQNIIQLAPEEYWQQWQKNLANLAITKSFLQKINHFQGKLTNNLNDEFIYLNRILKELECEVVYSPDAIVKENM